MRHMLPFALCAAMFGAQVPAARAEGDAARGEKVFGDCKGCHSLDRGAKSVGPSLHGIFDRKAGTGPDFNYSPALRRSGIVWTAETLDRFVDDPKRAVPNNRMIFPGIPSAQQRADLIAFMQKAFK